MQRFGTLVNVERTPTAIDLLEILDSLLAPAVEVVAYSADNFSSAVGHGQQSQVRLDFGERLENILSGRHVNLQVAGHAEIRSPFNPKIYPSVAKLCYGAWENGAAVPGKLSG